MTLFSEDLLGGRAIVAAGGVGEEVCDELTRLGARVEVFGPELGFDEEAAARWVRARAPLHALVYDAAPSFGAGGPAGLQSAVERGWFSIRALATEALIPAQSGGKLLLVGPAPVVGAHAQAATAALENLSRTLSVEWARHAVTSATIARGPASSDRELATLICFLVSPAGDYVTGTRLDLGLIRVS